MNIIAKKTEQLQGTILVPASKSHTIRAVAIALLANGTSIIKNPLASGDGLSALSAAEALGAEIEIKEAEWIINGVDGKPLPTVKTINVGNSGTTLRIMSSIAALAETPIKFDGDESTKKRPMQPLLDALQNLGAKAVSENNNGCAPITIKGPMQGGKTEVSGVTSQYLSSLLIACPLLKKPTTISIKELNEQPYVEMTLQWLDEQNIAYENDNFTTFTLKPNQSYKSFSKQVPGDWSSAAFPLCAAAITRSSITIKGLDKNDVQGDKAIINILEKMGAVFEQKNQEITIRVKQLNGITMNLNATPDLLPVMAVIGCFAEGKTEITNVPQARIKETDRIQVMCQELKKMGATIKETEDGLLIEKSKLKGTRVNGHHDHRVIMAMSCAGLGATGKTTIKNAANIDITFPAYVEKMQAMGAAIEME